MINPGLNYDRANSVYNDNGVVVDCCDGIDQRILADFSDGEALTLSQPLTPPCHASRLLRSAA